MRVLQTALATLLLLTAATADDPEKVRLQGLMQRADKRDPADRGEAYARLADFYAQSAGSSFKADDQEKARTDLAQMLDFARKAYVSAESKRKHMKETELKLREVSARLDRLTRTVGFQERERVIAAHKELDAIRDKLLEALFAPKKK